jgi:hypothetical protein
MSQVVIENPVINSPFDEPTRHFRFGDEGITDEIVDGRRTSSCFVPIARPRKKGGQLVFDTEWVQERIQENELINDIRRRVALWRQAGYPGVTPTTARLLAYAIRPDKCHISHVVADTDSWEQKLAETLEEMPEVVCYVKNHNLGFTIPYTLNGEEHQYTPDFIACLDDGRGPDALLNLLIEVSGEAKKDKAAKVATARTLWVPAINHHGGFGRWDFIEVADPWDAENTIRTMLLGEKPDCNHYCARLLPGTRGG